MASRFSGTRRALAGSLWALVFVVSCLLSVWVHQNHPVTRRAVAELANLALADVLYGRVEVGRVEVLTLDRIELSGATLFDEFGAIVIEVRDVRFDVDSLALLQQLLKLLPSDAPVNVVVRHARAERGEVHVRIDPTLEQPTLVRALTARPRTPGRPKQVSSEQPVRVYFPIVELGLVQGRLHEPGFQDIDPVLGHVRGSMLFSPKGTLIDVQRFGAKVSGVFSRVVRGTGSVTLRDPGALNVDFTGFVDDAQVEARLQLKDELLDVALSAPKLEAKTVESWLGSWPLTEPLALELRATGTLPELDTVTEVSAARGTLTLRGSVDLSGELSAQQHGELRELDLAALRSGAPTTELASSFDISAADLLGRYELVVSGSTEPTQILEQEVPAIDFDVIATPQRASAAIVAHEPGASIAIQSSLQDERLSLDASVADVDLQHQRRLRRTSSSTGLGGLTNLRLHANLEDEDVTAELEGELRRFKLGDVALGHADVALTARAKLSALTDAKLSGSLQATQLALGPVSFDRANAKATGDRRGAYLDATLSSNDDRSVSFAGWVAATGAVRDARFSVSQRELSLRGKLRQFLPDGPVIDVPEVSLRSPTAKLDGKFSSRPGVLAANFDGTGLRLERIFHTLGWKTTPARGMLELNLDVLLDKEVQRADVSAKVAHLSVDNWGDSDLSLQASLRDGDFSGKLEGKDALGFAVQGSWDGTLAGPALELHSWQALSGNCELALLSVPLQPLSLLLAPDELEALQGKVGVRVVLQRPEGQRLPHALLEIGAQVDQAVIKLEQDTLALEQLSAYYSGGFSADEHRFNGAGTLQDRHGTLLMLTSAFELHPERWLEDPLQAFREFRQAPINVVVNVPERPLEHFPLNPLAQVSARVGGQVALYGTWIEPQLSALLNAKQVLVPGLRSDLLAELSARGQYAPATGQLDLAAEATVGGRNALSARVLGVLPSLQTQNTASYSAELQVNRLPLESFAPLVSAQIAGSVTGRVSLSAEPEARMSAKLDFERLSSGRAVLGSGTLTARGGPGEVLASFASKGARQSVALKLSASGPVPRVPLPAELTSLDVALLTRNLEASALAPLLGGFVSRLGGDLSADLTWSGQVERAPALAGTDQTALGAAEPAETAIWGGELSGNAQLRRASGYVEALGLELRDVELDLGAEAQTGGTLLSLRGLKAKVRSERVNLTGGADLSLRGLRVVSGRADATLSSVPITVQGLNFGRASGGVSASIVRKQDYPEPGAWQGKEYLLAKLALVGWRVNAAPSASRQLIDLGSNPDVTVLQAKPKEKTNQDALPFRIEIDLGKRVDFSLADLEVPLAGLLRVDYTDDAVLSGTVQLQRGGRIPIFGRVFEVMDGSLLLNPKQPDNPVLDITLAGRATDDDLVYVHVGGTLKEPYTEPGPAELQALLGGGAASLLGSGVQALGVNQLLGDNVQLRVSSTDTESEEATYTAAVQLNDNLWFEANYQRLDGNSLNQDESEAVSGSLDYRFQKNWSVRTKVGNTGGSVDLLWQYRY